MDVNRLSLGEKIAGAAGLALIVIMFLGWWGAPDEVAGAAELAGIDTESASAWQAHDFMDIIWFLTGAAGIALAVLALSQNSVNLPVAMSAIVAGLGILSLLLVIYRLIDPPFDASREIGVFLGLIAIAAVAYGGWRAMQEEGTSFQGEADRVQSDRGAAPGAPPRDRDAGPGA
ncbi:MAG: hypothetical protein M3331_00410, partial [Actinomycetota bacterium]|nr:hypothetical protein [Actinomycetota bacterium]